jgi:exodeoxyribonuclease-3
MKIVSWNINGYRAITGQNQSKRLDTVSNSNKLFEYIEKAEPDIICLQETKANLEQIANELLFPLGYSGSYFSAERKGYSGVATFAKTQIINIEHKNGFGIEKYDVEGRVIITQYSDFSLFNVYFPNGKKDDIRLNYKLEFYHKLFQYVDIVRQKQPNIIVCGDYNTAHKPIDLAHPKENEKISGFLSIEREKLDAICADGYIDAFRLFNQEADQYSWWSNMRNARQKNVGWRIDYFFLTKPLEKKVKSCYMEQQILGSDHCPIVLELD